MTAKTTTAKTTRAPFLLDGVDQALRLKHRFTLEEIVNAAAWLASDLIEALVKIGAGQDPNPVMASDLARKNRDAETRLEIIRDIGKTS